MPLGSTSLASRNEAAKKGSERGFAVEGLATRGRSAVIPLATHVSLREARYPWDPRGDSPPEASLNEAVAPYPAGDARLAARGEVSVGSERGFAAGGLAKRGRSAVSRW
jgi:hypothetical protein